MNGTIYVIDDSVAICKMLTRFLQKWGYDVFAFTEPREGYEAISEAIPPFVVIVDWEMPGLSGIDICQRLKGEFEEQPVYIILLTGRDSISDLEKAFHAGVDDYIQKPFNERILKSRLSAGIKILNLEDSLIQQKNHLDQINNKLVSTIDIIKKDIDAGKKVQIRLLPENNFRFLDYSFDYYYQPSMALSGDFLDYFVINNRYLCFYFADVSGHGASSAFITILLKSFVSNKIHENNSDYSNQILIPDELMATFNRYIIELNLQKHLVLFYGVIDTVDSTLSYANAGQYPYPILTGPDGRLLLNKKNLFAGVFSGAKYDIQTIKLPPQYRLTFFSDGILDIIEGETIEQRAEQLYSYADQSATLDELMNNLLMNANLSQPPDDLTILHLTKEHLNDG